MTLDLNDIAVFVAVVQARGFTAAGRILDLPPSTVSRRIARLERSVGLRLLHRTTRSVGLTEAGRLFFERTGAVPRLVDEALAALAATQQAPSGTLRVTAPPDDGGVIWALLSRFLRDHPDVDLQILHTLERVDLIEQGIDVALRGGPPPDTTVFVAHQLFDSRILLAASPEYLALRGTPRRVEELSEHDGICMDPWAPNAIRRLDGDRAPVRLQIRNRIRANSLDTAQKAAIDGFGIAPLLELTCRPALERGALVEVLRGALPESAPLWLLAPRRRARSAAVDALVRSVRATAATLQPGVGPAHPEG